MRVLRVLPRLLPVVAVTVLALHTGSASAGESLLVSGLPGLAPPSAADFAVNGNDEASGPADMSADGRFVVFASMSDGLVSTPEDRRYQHVFVKDRQTGQLTNVTAGANGSSGSPSISNDGTTVAFETLATNLASADTTRDADVLVRHLASGTTTLITGTGDDGASYTSHHPQLSGNGTRVAFVTSTALVPGDTNGVEDVYTRLASGGSTKLVSGTAGVAANEESEDPTISDDGDIVAFASRATNLIANDLGGDSDVFVRDTVADTMVRASAVSGSTQAGNKDAYSPVLSGDGAYVAFSSFASNLTAADTDARKDILRRQVDRGHLTTGPTVLSSAAPGPGVDDRYYDGPVISSTGFRVGYYAYGQGDSDLFVRDASAPAAASLGLGNGASLAAMNGSGSLRVILRGNFAPAVEPGPTVVAAGSTAGEVVSRPSDGTPLVPRLFGTDDDDTYRGWPQRLSANGRFAVFTTASPALPGGGDGKSRVFRRDLRTGQVDLVSRATGPNGAPADVVYGEPTISADGNRVAFGSEQALEPDAGGAARKGYVRDLRAGTTTLVSRPSGTAPYAPPQDVDRIQLSADGRHVLFLLEGLGQSAMHAYVRDLDAATTELADRTDGAAGAPSAQPVERASLSGNGRRVAFTTYADNFGDGAPPNTYAVRLRDLDAGSTVLVSRASGADGAVATGDSTNPVISADGNVVAFDTRADNLDPSAGGWADGSTTRVVLRDLAHATTTLVSRAPGAGPVADRNARSPSLSADGQRVAYTSEATNLGNDSGVEAVFVRTVATGEQTVVGVSGDPDPGGASHGAGASIPSLSADGRCLLYAARGVDVVPGVSPDYYETFARALEGTCGVTDDPSTGGGGGGPVPGGPGGPGGPGNPPRSEAAPRITALRLTRPRFRVGPGRTATTRAATVRAATARTATARAATARAATVRAATDPSAATRPAAGQSATVGAAARRKPRRAPAGTVVRFTLSARADVRFTIEARSTGRRVGKRCRPATKRLRRRRSCVRWQSKGVLSRRAQAAGARTLVFSGRIGRRALRPGRYRVTLVATGAGGRSRPATATFTVTR